ncbi:GntR family transcriptional regulator [Klebsiella variicola subsp. variicola]|nr:GntR family transcriptional regulator [Klebsiella variicola subsp. variicola]
MSKKAAQYYNVSRSVIRESLMRLRDKGLVEKEPYSQWLTGPLTAREIADHFEIRAPASNPQRCARLDLTFRRRGWRPCCKRCKVIKVDN